MIVAGSDLSRGSEAALRLASWLAERRRSGLHVVHALETPAPLDAGERAALTAALQEHAPASASIEIVDGGAVDALARAECAVVGAEGASATLVPRAGHVPSELAATGRVPELWVAPQGWRPRETSRGDRLLAACALDERDASLLGAACTIGGSRASLHLAHVVDVSAARHHPPAARGALAALAAERAAEADDRLRALAADGPLDLAAAAPSFHVVRQGPVARDLAGLAESQGIDVLVVGAGAVASALVTLARCPLLVLPGKEPGLQREGPGSISTKRPAGPATPSR